MYILCIYYIESTRGKVFCYNTNKIMITDIDYIVLVDEQNRILGTAPKLSSHHKHTPLHRAFSLFIFNHNQELLLQQRALHKKTWPGIWSNSVCGHLLLEDTPESAAKRRLEFELGIDVDTLINVLPTYQYRFEKDEIVENEICPVLVGLSDDSPILNMNEVKDIQWIKWEKWVDEIKNNGDAYSPWSVEETKLLEKNEKWKKKIFEYE